MPEMLWSVPERAAPPGTTCADAVSRTTAAKSDSLLVVDDNGWLCGILTEQDVKRRVVLRLSGETPVDDVMSAPVLTIGDGDYLYHAIAHMRRARLRHMSVIDTAGRVVGELHLNDALPLVKGVRLYPLRGGIAATSTLARIDAPHAAGVLDADEQDYLSGIFRHITDLLLRQQIAEFKVGGTVDNRVPVSALSAREKDMLVDGFRAIEAFRERIGSDLTGELFRYLV